MAQEEAAKDAPAEEESKEEEDKKKEDDSSSKTLKGANLVLDRMEKANEEKARLQVKEEEMLARKERLKVELVLGGEADAGEEAPKPKEDSYQRRRFLDKS